MHAFLPSVESGSRSVVSDSLQPPGTLVHGTLQARILEWVAFPFSRGSCQPRDRTQVSRIAGGFFTSLGTREAQDKMGPQDEKPCLVLRATLCVCLAFLHLPWPVLTGGGVSREAVCA